MSNSSPSNERVDAVTDAKVLVIEDVQEVAFVMKYALEGAGFDVKIVESAEEARASCAKAEPDLVLLDLQLNGGESGLDFCRSYLGNERGAADVRPVIVCTASRERETIRACYRAGAALVLTKPVDIVELNSVASRVIRARRRLLEADSRRNTANA